MNLIFQHRMRLNETIWQYTFRPEQPVRYIPGQYARFRFPFVIGEPDSKQHRTMTLVSHPSDATIDFATRFSEPCSVYKQHLQALQPGDRMNIDEPRGDVVLPKSPAAPLIFVAGGVGIASFISMLRDVNVSGQARTISLLYGMHTTSDKVYGSLLDSFPFANFTAYISPHYITGAAILAAGNDNPQALYYISGTEHFVASLRSQLEAAGLDHSRIIFDYFSGY